MTRLTSLSKLPCLSGSALFGSPLVERPVTIKVEIYHLHPNGGGRVASPAMVEDSVFIGPYAVVWGQAVVSGNVRLEDDSLIAGNARVSGRVHLQHRSRIDGFADVSGSIWLQHHSQISDRAIARGSIHLMHFGRLVGDDRVTGRGLLIEA